MKKYMFTAKWCGNCDLMKPIIKELADIEIIDIEENPEYVEKFMIMSLPAYVVENGDEFDSMSGILDKASVVKFYG